MWLIIALLITYSNALTFTTNENYNTNTALKIKNPSIHQTYLTSLDKQPRYFEFDIKNEDKLEISLFTSSSSEDDGLVAGLALLCSNSEFTALTTSVYSTNTFSSSLANDTFFNFTENYYDMFFETNSPSKTSVQYTDDYYPATKRVLVDLTITNPPSGHYFLVVLPHTNNKKSHVGFTIGTSIYNFDRISTFLLTPFDVIMYFHWQHKSIISITVPLAAPVLLGLVFYILIAILKKLVVTIHEWIMALASLAFLSTSVLWLTQLIYCIVQSSQNNTYSGFTAIVIALSLIYTAFAAAEALRKKEDYPDLYWHKSNRYLSRFLLRRLALLFWSGLALFTWSGYIVGPGLVFVAAILPPSVSYYPQSKILSEDNELYEMDVQRARYSV